MMFNTLLFDFNGLILDDEMIHLDLFRQVLLIEDITFTDQDYWEKYVGFDDKGFFKTIYEHREVKLTPKKLHDLIESKAQLYLPTLKGKARFFPGVIDFIRKVFGKYHMAVVSGALRPEIEYALETAGIKDVFPLIVSAEDTKHGKPDPEGYLIALAKMKKEHPEIKPETCLVLEDSLAGIESAHRARMKVVALTHTYPKEDLVKEADYVCDDFDQVQKILNAPA